MRVRRSSVFSQISCNYYRMCVMHLIVVDTELERVRMRRYDELARRDGECHGMYVS